VFLLKSWTGWLEFEADFAHVYITVRGTVGSHEKSPASVQCRGKTVRQCTDVTYVVHLLKIGVGVRG